MISRHIHSPHIRLFQLRSTNYWKWTRYNHLYFTLTTPNLVSSNGVLWVQKDVRLRMVILRSSRVIMALIVTTACDLAAFEWRSATKASGKYASFVLTSSRMAGILPDFHFVNRLQVPGAISNHYLFTDKRRSWSIVRVSQPHAPLGRKSMSGN